MIFSEVRNSCTLHLFICLSWLLWITSIHVKAVSDTLNPGEALNTSTSLCSMNGKYCLYFAKYDDINAYLAIHCTVDDWVVWVANRKLFYEEFAVLSLDHNGVLKIETQNEEPMILYSSPQQNNHTAATLLDTGNFVLREISTGEVLWQTFDFPADTLLPGMKLGVDHKSGHTWSVVSFLGGTPAPGPFSLEWESSEGELVIKRHGNVCWKSGRLNIDNRFEHIPEEVQRIYEYNIVSNVDEKYFRFATDPNDLLGKWTLLDTGQLMNKKGDDIARADMCYGYNTNGGCQKWEDIPSCRNHGDEFVTKEGYPNYSSDNMRFDSNTSNGISDCKASCWKDCTCFGFTTYNENGTGCIFFLNSTKGINLASGGQSFYVLAKNNSSNNDPNNYQEGSGSRNWKWKIAVIAATLLIIFPFLALKLRKHNLKEKDKNINLKSEMLDLEPSSVYSIVKDLRDLNKGHDLKVFSYASIKEATNDFSSENKLGQGGFGPVYKGTLPNGEEVAVKRLSRTSGQGVVEFKNELALISELQHNNLVQLLGHCINKQERMLVYEYMPNKSLDFFLFDSTQSKLLDWSKRFSIIEGIAQGLLYLHKYSRVKIIHRDLKASNILLDKDMNPKISDFGIARMFTQHETEANTNKIVGTIGYMSPEYFMDGIFSIKSDVYSFGVLLLEIISGRRNKSFYTDERPLNLVGHAWELWKQGKVIQLVDPVLKESFDKDEVIRCIHIGLLCVEENANDRPCMSTVISLLTNKNATSSVPKRPAYYVRAEVSENNMVMSKEFDTECIFENSLYHER